MALGRIPILLEIHRMPASETRMPHEHAEVAPRGGTHSEEFTRGVTLQARWIKPFMPAGESGAQIPDATYRHPLHHLRQRMMHFRLRERRPRRSNTVGSGRRRRCVSLIVGADARAYMSR